MRKRYKLLLGTLLGIALIFFLPLMPVPLSNMEGTSTSIAWFSGLFILGTSLKDLLLIESLGGLTGFLLSFIYVGGFD